MKASCRHHEEDNSCDDDGGEEREGSEGERGRT